MSQVTRAWAVVNKHIPMIKFRKMALDGHEQGSFQHAVKTAEPNAVKLTPSQSKTSAIIEDWQITNRYRRKPISQEEIDFINRGGPQ